MNTKSIEQAKDPDMATSIAAMKRAAKRAGQIAAQTGTSLIRWHDGHVERVSPDAADANYR